VQLLQRWCEVSLVLLPDGEEVGGGGAAGDVTAGAAKNVWWKVWGGGGGGRGEGGHGVGVVQRQAQGQQVLPHPRHSLACKLAVNTALILSGWPVLLLLFVTKMRTGHPKSNTCDSADLSHSPYGTQSIFYISF
jgi:hypothetical protein